MQPKTTKTEEILNYDLYKENSKYYQMAVKQMIRAIIKKTPRNILIDVLKSEKIIKRNWSEKGEFNERT